MTDEKERHCLRAGASDDGDFAAGMFRIGEEAGWPYYVNGVEEDSLFDGIMYAG